MREPQTPLLPAFSKKENKFVEQTERGATDKLRRLLRVHGKKPQAQLGLFRHVIQTQVGRGDKEITDLLSALLCHSPTTALKLYELTNRRQARRAAFRHILAWLKPQRPMALRGPNDDDVFAGGNPPPSPMVAEPDPQPSTSGKCF